MAIKTPMISKNDQENGMMSSAVGLERDRGQEDQTASSSCCVSLPESLLKRLDCASQLEKQFLYDEIFVQECYTCTRDGHIVDVGGGDGCIIDVGANIGLFTLFCAEKGRRAGSLPKIIAVEPVHRTFTYLKRNIGLYKEMCKHNDVPEIVPLQVAVTADSRDGDIEFVSYPHAPGWNCMSSIATDNKESMKRDLRVFVRNAIGDSSTSLPRWLRYIGSFLDRVSPWMVDWVVMAAMWCLMFGAQRVRCSRMTVSQIMEAHDVDHVDMLKIDVEGGELHVLKGLQDDSWKKIRQVVAEVHEKNLDQVEMLCRRHFSRVILEQAPDMKGTSLWMMYCSQHINKYSM